MLMALGMFVFGLPTLAYQDLQRQTTWRHPSNSRVGSRPARQFVGPGDDTITLSGVLVPELMGRAASLDELRAMADTGAAWALASGAGGATTISITINAAPGMDPQAVARAVSAELDRRERAKRSRVNSLMSDID